MGVSLDPVHWGRASAPTSGCEQTPEGGRGTPLPGRSFALARAQMGTSRAGARPLMLLLLDPDPWTGP